MRSRLIPFSLCFATALAACSGGGSSSDSGDPQSGGTLKVGMSSEVTTLDPAKGSANAMALTGYAIYDTLKSRNIRDIIDQGLHEFLEDFILKNNQLGLDISEGYRFYT